MRVIKTRVEIRVPAQGLLGDPPTRSHTFQIRLPPAYQVVRESGNFGAVVVHENLGGLEENVRTFTAIPDGVSLTWELQNEHSFPIDGRSALLEIEVKAERVIAMALSESYVRLRQRLIDRFWFSGSLAEWTKTSHQGGKVKFADQTIYQGQALLVLATELAILRDSNQDTADAASRITQVLDAIDDLDQKANGRFGGDAAGPLDGFIARDDIDGPTDPRLSGRFAEADSDWQQPEEERASPSGDQVFGLLFGLLAVTRHSGDPELVERARETAARLFDYARRSHFDLKLPNGDSTRRGSDMRWLSSLLHGLQLAITGNDLFDTCTFTALGVEHGLTGIAAFWDSPSTAAVVANVAATSVDLPLVGSIALNAFARHILLMALAPSEVWDQEEIEAAAMASNHHLSVLIFCQLHGVLPRSFDAAAVANILAACPANGPRANAPSDSGWGHDNRWIRCSNIFEAQSGDEEYNALDWLALHNLQQIVFACP